MEEYMDDEDASWLEEEATIDFLEKLNEALREEQEEIHEVNIEEEK